MLLKVWNSAFVPYNKYRFAYKSQLKTVIKDSVDTDFGLLVLYLEILAQEQTRVRRHEPSRVMADPRIYVLPWDQICTETPLADSNKFDNIEEIFNTTLFSKERFAAELEFNDMIIWPFLQNCGKSPHAVLLIVYPGQRTLVSLDSMPGDGTENARMVTYNHCPAT